MKLDLEKNVAVVAGGANGIGRAIAEAFAAEGAEVAILDISPHTSAVAAELREKRGVRITSEVCDITDLTALEEARSRIRNELGGHDHVVIAAGVGSGKFGYPFLNLDPADWERVLSINVMGAVNLTHVFAPDLMSRKGSSILYISSVAAQFGSQTDPPYSASKAALLNFAQCVARDLASSDVRVNSICPGMVRTALNRSVWEAWNRRQPPDQRRDYEDWAGEKVRNVVPLGRWQEPEDIAALAVFLASSRAKNITGQTINVDGGYIMK